MKALHSFIKTLSRSELRIVRISLTSFASRNSDESNTLKLLNFLDNRKEHAPTNEECSKLLYKKEKDPRFKMLKSRLKSKIFDTLLNNINTDKKYPHIDEFHYAFVKIKKKLALLIQLYTSKGNHPYITQNLTEIVSLSKKWENYPSVVESLQFIKLMRGFRQGENEFNKINEEIEFYQNCDHAVMRANDCYYRLMMKTYFSGTPDVFAIQKFLKESITLLHKDYDLTKSVNVAYYLKYLELAYFQNEDNYLKAKSKCVQLINLISKNKSVYRKQRIGGIYLNL